MSKLNKQVLITATCFALANHSARIPVFSGIYDIRPKNSFRGGSIGKSGKIKYRRG